MNGLRQCLGVVSYNFRQWKKNPRIIITFALAFILCFLLTDKAVGFAQDYGTPLQMLEPFIWAFGDSDSILLMSLLLILLFADMPFLSSGTPFFLMRMNRRRWITGQLLYTLCATTLFLLFVLVSTMVVCARQSYPGNLWSDTAAILGYSGVGEEIALPSLVKTLELSYPYQCAATIFGLMLCYTLVLVFVMLVFTLWKGSAAGIIIETPGFLPNLTGRKNLELLASLRRQVDGEGIKAAIRQVGLDPELKKPVGKYSLGMRQRLGIAQAIMENPSLLILDEPFNGLDKHGVAQMRTLILGLREQGKTVLLASHNQGDIDALCDTVCEMDGGILSEVKG